MDNVNNDGEDGRIIFEGKQLASDSALVAGKRRVDRLVSWGGSALIGDNYTNVLLLSDQVTNEQRGWGDATAMHEARGTSRGLAGHFAKGKSPPLATQTDWGHGIRQWRRDKSVRRHEQPSIRLA